MSDDAILPDNSGTDRETLAAQAEMFRLAERDHGLTLAVLAMETGIPKRTLATYCNSNPFARAKLPLPVFVALCGVIPDACTSVVFASAGKFIGTAEPSDGDVDALGREAAGYVAEKLEAEADGIVTHIERRKLADRARRIAPIARRVAA